MGEVSLKVLNNQVALSESLDIVSKLFQKTNNVLGVHEPKDVTLAFQSPLLQ